MGPLRRAGTNGDGPVLGAVWEGIQQNHPGRPATRTGQRNDTRLPGQWSTRSDPQRQGREGNPETGVTPRLASLGHPDKSRCGTGCSTGCGTGRRTPEPRRM